MRIAKALRIVIETGAARCDGASLTLLRALVDDAPPPLALRIEDPAAADAIAAALPVEAAHSPRRLAEALHCASAAALPLIPPIDHLPTRSRAKQALKAVAALERLAAALEPGASTGAKAGAD